MQLYGFLKKDDTPCISAAAGREWNRDPKAALGMLSALFANDIRFVVLAGDAKAIARAPGLVRRQHRKMILELKDKFDLQETFDSSLAESTEGTIPTGTTRQIQDEAGTGTGGAGLFWWRGAEGSACSRHRRRHEYGKIC